MLDPAMNNLMLEETNIEADRFKLADKISSSILTITLHSFNLSQPQETLQKTSVSYD